MLSRAKNAGLYAFLLRKTILVDRNRDGGLIKPLGAEDVKHTGVENLGVQPQIDGVQGCTPKFSIPVCFTIRTLRDNYSSRSLCYYM